MAKALVVIDVQKGMFADPLAPPHDGQGVLRRIAMVIAKARACNAPIFFVQHQGSGKDVLQPGKPGFAFCDEIAPLSNDNVTVKRQSSAFHATDFDARLKKSGIDHLIVTGMQSEYCVDSALRGAFERGYRLTLVGDAHSTFDTKVAKARDIIAIQNDTMRGGFAEVKSADEITF